jgi:hypothetical protein
MGLIRDRTGQLRRGRHQRRDRHHRQLRRHLRRRLVDRRHPVRDVGHVPDRCGLQGLARLPDHVGFGERHRREPAVVAGGLDAGPGPVLRALCRAAHGRGRAGVADQLRQRAPRGRAGAHPVGQVPGAQRLLRPGVRHLDVGGGQHVVPGRARRRPGHRKSNGTLRFAYAAADGAAAESFASTSVYTYTAATWARSTSGSCSARGTPTWTSTTSPPTTSPPPRSWARRLRRARRSWWTRRRRRVRRLSTAATDLYGQAIRSSVKISWSVSATFGGAPVIGATDLAPVGGSITHTNKPGVSRVLNVDLAPPPGVSAQALFDLLEPGRDAADRRGARGVHRRHRSSMCRWACS